jgi:hypothetical protein
MAAITANVARDVISIDQRFPLLAMQVNATTTIYVGGVTFQDAVTFGATDTSNAGANRVMGVAYNYYANTGVITTLADPPLFVQMGQIELLTGIVGLTAASLHKPVYATTSGDFTMTAAGASLVGYVWKFVSGLNAYVSINSLVV